MKQQSQKQITVAILNYVRFILLKVHISCIYHGTQYVFATIFVAISITLQKTLKASTNENLKGAAVVYEIQISTLYWRKNEKLEQTGEGGTRNKQQKRTS